MSAVLIIASIIAALLVFVIAAVIIGREARRLDRGEVVADVPPLDGLAALGNQTAPQRSEILRALAAVTADRNPRLARRAEEILQKVYEATPGERNQARRAKP